MSKPSDYARGTAYYAAVESQYGSAEANRRWQAAINAEKNQAPLDTSTWSIFADQIYNDPLAAPLEQANKIAGNTLAAAFKNPLASLTIIGGGVAISAAVYFFFIKRK